MLAIPSAKGLFHRAIIQSAAGVRMIPRDYANAFANAFIKDFGLTKDQVANLHNVPYEQLYAATAPATAAAAKVVPAGGRSCLAPVVDGAVLP